MTKLTISPELQLPVDAVTETFGILAVKRAGKSNAAVVMAEEMFDAGLPWVAIDPKGDWWGIRSSADGNGPGLPILVLGGLHGDVPLEAASGHLVADLVVDQRLTCVIDVSEMSKADQRRFLADFAERLYKRNREPLHVFCEEADEYIPQMVRGDVARLVGAFETLVKRGGFRGLGITLITQRSASLNKDVLTQIQTLFAMRTTSPQDRKAILAWVVQHAVGQQMVDELPALASGEAWMFSPNWLHKLEKITFRRRRTFDSGATPKVGVKARPLVTLAEVDIAALRERMASTIEKAKADDPGELHKQIAELRRQLHQSESNRRIETREVRVEVPVLDLNQVRRIQDAVERSMQKHSGAVSELLALMVRGVDDLIAEVVKSAPARLQGQVAKPADRTPSRPPVSVARPVPSPESKSNGHVQISSAQQRILDAGAFLEGLGVMQPDVVQLALIAGQSAAGGYWRANIGRLRTAGMVEGTSLTAAGRALAQPPAINTTEQLHAHVMGMLQGAQKAILQVLIDAYPEELEPAEVGRRAGLETSGGYWRACVGRLRSLQLITKRGPMAALQVLFIEEAARR